MIEHAIRSEEDLKYLQNLCKNGVSAFLTDSLVLNDFNTSIDINNRNTESYWPERLEVSKSRDNDLVIMRISYFQAEDTYKADAFVMVGSSSAHIIQYNIPKKFDKKFPEYGFEWHHRTNL